MLADFDRKFFAKLNHIVGQRLDHGVAFLQLKIGQALLHAPFERRTRVRVAAIEIKNEWMRVALCQRIAPARGQDERSPDVVFEQIGFVLHFGRQFFPLKSFVLFHDVDETLRARRVVAIDQERGHVCHFIRLKGVTENESEDRRQDEQEHENAPVAINVQKFFVSDARDRAERCSFHDVDLFKSVS